MKKMNKTARRNALTYGGVILAYIIMQSLSSTGHISSTLSGLLVPFCYYVILAVSLNLDGRRSGRIKPWSCRIYVRGCFYQCFLLQSVRKM